MSEITITGLNRSVHPRANKAGHVTLAHFHFEMRGIAFRNWSLVRRTTGEHQAWPPMFDEGGSTTRRSVSFRDLDLRDELNERVIETFRLMGGKIEESAAA